MSSHLMDPGAGAAETRMNRDFRRTGTPLRACLHADSTLESRSKDGGRIVVRTCDYCPSTVWAVAGSVLPDMAPWIYNLE